MTATVEQTSSQGPRLGFVGWLRWGWRTLTSMRTALILLLLLALASIPGSVFPQRGTDAARVQDWIDANPTTGPWLDRLGMFDVFAAPWFAAIYLLLCISLIGCIIPRTAEFVRLGPQATAGGTFAVVPDAGVRARGGGPRCPGDR